MFGFRTVDRYIFREYLRMLLIILAGIVFIFIVVNFFETLDRFVERKAPPWAVARYYLWQVPYIAGMFLPVAELLAAFFSLGELARRNELLALKAAGIRTTRTFIPIFLVGLLATAATLWANMGLIPIGLRKSKEVRLFEIEKRQNLALQTVAEKIAFLGEGNRIFYFERIDANKNSAKNPLIIELDDEGNVVKRIDARKGVFKEGHWEFQRSAERTWDETGEAMRFFPSADHPEITQEPFEFLKVRKELLEMPIADLSARINSLTAAGMRSSAERVEFWIRFAFPFMCLIILFFAAPLSASMRGMGRAYGFGISLMLAFAYWALFQLFRTLGDAGRIDPLVGAWGPNIAFVLLSLPVMFRVKS